MEQKIINIDRNAARVSEWDKIYCEIVKDILENGVLVKNRTGIDTLTTGTVTFKLKDIEHNFPILESKKVAIKNAVSEIQWIHQVQSNDVRWLQERENPIWNKWMIDKDGIYREYEPEGTPFEEKEIEVCDVNGNPKLDKYGKIVMTEATDKAKEKGMTIKSAKYFGKKWAYTIGKAYGYNNKQTKDPQDVLEKIKNKPDDRRMIIDLRVKKNLKYGTLEPCVWATEWRVINGKLDVTVIQRSGDIPVGVPFNVSQYAVLLKMFAKVNNLEAGDITYTINDAHIYVDQVEPIKKQINRYNYMCFYETFIREHSDTEVIKYYDTLKKQEERLRKYTENNPNDKKVLQEYKVTLEEFRILDFMLTKKKPEFEAAEIDDFFNYSTDVNSDPEYLKENPTGNKELVLKNYSSLPFIKIPVAQ